MARVEARLPENAPGDLFVDSTCIDCDLCRQLAPGVFAQSARSLSFVERQPATPEALQRALIALVTCPTASIGTTSHTPVTDAVAALPEAIEDEVYFCGFASADSYGASSYLVRRPDGNVLVDSPRAAEPLMRRIEALGGVRYLFLTHADDVADHRRWHERFGCTRVMHEADLGRDTRDVEQPLRGIAPIALADDLVAVPVPGHTAGSTALLYRDTFLFTGDHLWWSPDHERLHASHSVCWSSWPEQLRSLARLRDLRFEWVLPGHGRRHHAASPDAMRAEIDRAIHALTPR
jgi:glyoxylase-like metal-dependent hydrolase (beta-lactamase superfamily II)/ferredoxin